MGNPVRQLILVRLLVPGTSGLDAAKVKKELSPLVQHRWFGAEWDARFESDWNALSRDGLLEDLGGKKLRKYRLSPEGWQEALRFLGVDDVPAKTTWPTLRDKYLVPRALGLVPDSEKKRKAIGSPSGLQASILRQAHDLPAPEFPTATQAYNALLWKQLGVESTDAFSLAAVKKVLYSRILNVSTPIPEKQAKPRISALAVGARRNDAAELRQAVLRTWLDREAGEGDDSKTAAGHTPNPPEAIVPPAGEGHEPDLQEFARDVLLAARAAETGWFGEKVFISHVWRQYQRQYPESRLGDGFFKKLLLLAHRQGLLALSRADLVEAMDPVDVRESETTYLNAVFHFVRVPSEGR